MSKSAYHQSKTRHPLLELLLDPELTQRRLVCKEIEEAVQERSRQERLNKPRTVEEKLFV